MRERMITIICTALFTSLIWSEFVPREKIEVIEVTETCRHKTNWDKLIEAIIWRESKGNDKAVNHKTNAVGCMQITPIYVKQVNVILGRNKYKLSDRYSRTKSIEMFNIYQEYYNPNKDLHLAIKLHNPRAKWSYHRDIEEKYNELMNKK